MSGDAATLTLGLLALGTLGLLSLLLGELRELASPGARPYVWEFLRRRGKSPEPLATHIGPRGVRAAELRCATCPSRPACAALVAAGAATPAPGCPNASLFQPTRGAKA